MTREDDLSFLTHLVQEPLTLFEYRDRLKQYHFRDDNARLIYSVLENLAVDNDAIPTEQEIKFYINNGSIPVLQNLSPLEKQHLLRDVGQVYNQSITGATGNRVRQFISQRELLVMSQQLKDTNLGTIEAQRKFVEKMRAKLGRLDEILDPVTNNPPMFPLTPESIGRIPETLAGIFDQNVIPLPWERFNSIIGGGLHKGEFSLVVGLTGHGKTTTLLNVAMHASACKKMTIMYCLDDTETQIQNRVYCYTAGMSSQGVELHELQQRVEMNVSEQGNPYLCIRVFPRATVSPEFIRRDLAKIRIQLERMAEDGLFPEPPEIELVIVDYIDVLKMPGNGEFRHQLLYLSNGLGSIAGQENVHVMAGTQSNAKGMRQDVLDEGNIAEGFSKGWACKLGLAICGNRAELTGGNLRYALWKNTWGPAGFINPCEVIWEKQQIYETIGACLMPITAQGRNESGYAGQNGKPTTVLKPSTKLKIGGHMHG